MREAFHLAHSVRMSAEDRELAEVMLYGEIVPDLGKFYKECYPNDKCAVDFDKEIKAVREAGAKRLMLRINSPGGIVFEAVAMRSIIANAGFSEITVRIEGLCASAATIPASLPGATVQIAEGSEYMIHNPWTYAWGSAADLEHEAEHLRSMEKTIRSLYAAKSGQEDGQIKEWMDNETWMTAKEAVERGFCDELLKAEQENAEPAAACVSPEGMAIMQSLYGNIPKAITVQKLVCTGVPKPVKGSRPYGMGGAADRCAPAGENGATPAGKAPETDAGTAPEDGRKAGQEEGRTENPAAGFSSVNKTQEEEPTMEIKDITRDQLLAENPALAEEIRNSAIAAERERLAEIDALCMPGYEALAEEAKANGTSASDFQKAIVRAMKDKEKSFIEQRKKETAPAAQIAGGSPSDGGKTEADELAAFAKEMAGYAEASKNETMF